MRFPFEAHRTRCWPTRIHLSMRYFRAWHLSSSSCPKERVSRISRVCRRVRGLKKDIGGFHAVRYPAILAAALKCPVILIVLRAILGFTPPEWAYIASSRKGLEIPQNAARALDRDIRCSPNRRLEPGAITLARITALVETACELIAGRLPRCALRTSCTASARRTVWRGCPPSNGWPIWAHLTRCCSTSDSSEDPSPGIGIPSVSWWEMGWSRP